MSQPFKSKRPDGRAQWRVVFDRIMEEAPGTVITYEVLETLIETKVRREIYPVVSATNRKLWQRGQRSLQVVPRVGYRILKAAEHEHQATGYQRQARRRLGNAVAVVNATDLTQLTPEQRNWTLQIATGLTMMARAIDDHASKLAKHDDLIRELQDRIKNLEQP